MLAGQHGQVAVPYPVDGQLNTLLMPAGPVFDRSLIGPGIVGDDARGCDGLGTSGCDEEKGCQAGENEAHGMVVLVGAEIKLLQLYSNVTMDLKRDVGAAL